jgi:LysM repeat protein
MPPLRGAVDAPPAPLLMKKKRNWLARFLALVALIAAIVAIVVVAKNTDLNSNSGKKSHTTKTQEQQPQKKKPRTTKKTYTVQSGDTLTSISHKTGIPVGELQALNPEVDPQILIAGETLKLQK